MAPRQSTTPGFNDPRYKALINRLKDRRKDLGLSQQALADQLGLHKQFVSRFELGERRLDVVEFADVARILHLDVAEVAGAIPQR